MLYRIDVAGVDQELIAARLWAAGTTGIEERAACLIAGFDEPVDLTDIGAPVTLFEPAVDWVEAQREAMRPTIAGGFFIHPPWLEPTNSTDSTTISIDPGAAFGHGGHPTTALCVELLADTPIEERIVGDVGCGTGILAIASALLGAHHVWATDIDPVAVDMTRQNADANGVDIEMIATPQHADLILSNVTIDIHEDLAPHLSAPELILSGVLTDQIDRLEAAHGASLLDLRFRDGWVAGRIVRT